MNWTPLLITFKLALITTVLLVIIGIPIATWLAHSKWKYKPVIEALISMPLVLPPTVIGFYLLVAFSPTNAFGDWLSNTLGVPLVFSFSGLVVGSIIYSLPFMINPLQSGFASIPTHYREASYLMGKSKLTTLFKVLLPNMKASVLTAIVLTFAHTVGEFGVVLMIGGNIPGVTRVASIEIYDQVEALNYGAANQYSIILFVLTFLILVLVYAYNGGILKRQQ